MVLNREQSHFIELSSETITPCQETHCLKQEDKCLSSNLACDLQLYVSGNVLLNVIYPRLKKEGMFVLFQIACPKN